MITIGLPHLDRLVAREFALQAKRVLRMELAGDEAITRPQSRPNQPGRAGIAAQCTARRPELAVVGRDRREIAHDGSGHAGPRRRQKPQDACFRLPRTACFDSEKVVPASAGMSVEHEQLLVLGRQQTKELTQSHMLQDFSKVSSVKCVPIVHGSL